MFCANQSWFEGWAFEIWLCSTILYWLNKIGGSFMIRTPCFIESLRLASSLQSQIMEAKNSQIGIYAWKTILMGGKLLKQGEK